MKELSTEEKARLYDEALENAKHYHSAMGDDVCCVLEECFPELIESEDERIRKELLDFLHQLDIQGYTDWRYNSWVAWLEKQAEHANFLSKIQVGDKVTRNEDGVLVNLSQLKRVAKPADRVEPKFKVGKWYQCTKGFFGKGVTFDKNTAYYCAKEGCLQNEHGCHIAIAKDLYDNFKLWTIEDAKDGDVLVTNSNIIFIFKYLDEGGTIAFSASCTKNSGAYFPKIKERLCDQDVNPATKEQRDLLFQKMKEAGYEWDSKKKELKKVEQKPITMSLDEAIEHCKEKSCGNNACALEHKQLAEWLNELKELRSQATWKPSEEQMKYLHKYAEQNNYDGAILTSLYKDLKQLKQFWYGN